MDEKREHGLKEKKNASRLRYLRRKSWLDRGIAFVLLWILTPYLLGMWAVLKISGEGRLALMPSVGKDGALFLRLCFVPVERTAEEYRLRGEETGYFARLHRAGLVSLPSLFNVLWGDMSLVGPVPVSPSAHRRIRERERAGVLTLRPGMVSLGGQSSPRAEVYERLYLKGCGLRMDCFVLSSAYKRIMQRHREG